MPQSAMPDATQVDIVAVRWVFFLQPFVIGAWFPRIPQVQATSGLGEGALALALMGMPLGLLVALSFGGRLAEALGTRSMLKLGLCASLAVTPLAGFAGSGYVLFAALVVSGLALALAELSMNIVASEVEVRSGRSIMNSAHGFWSLGVLAGSAIGSVQASVGLAPGISLVAVSLLTLIPVLRVAFRITDFAVDGSPRGGPREPLPRALILIALFAFGIAMTEGAMADWSAIFLTQVFDASPGLAGVGFVVFAGFVALGRFCGDALKVRWGAVLLAQSCAVLALLGLMLAVLAPVVAVSLAGLAMLGLGVSLGFPLAVSAASILPGRSSAANVATLTQITLCGFLLGPPIIGLVAEAGGMRWGLAALFPVLVLAFVLAPRLAPIIERRAA